MAGEPRRIVPEGGVRSMRNDSGSTIDAETVVMKGNTEDEMQLPSAITDHVAGVLMHDCPDGEYGNVQVAGRAISRAHGALATPGTGLMPTTAGRVDTWSAGGAGNNAAVVGLLSTAAAAQDDRIEVDLQIGMKQQ